VINFLLNWVEECSIDDFFSIEGAACKDESAR
jgi:hypothetical protein